MKTALKIAGIVLLATFLIMQLFRPDRTNTPVPRSQTVFASPTMTPAVETILRTSCYDCHGTETNWPWYSNIAPFSWLVAHDVEEGRKKLNLSTWGSYTEKRRAHKGEEIVEEVEEGKMPPDIYTIIHRDAVLTPEQQATLVTWARAVMGTAPEGKEEEED